MSIFVRIIVEGINVDVKVSKSTNYRVLKGGSFAADPVRCGYRSKNHQTYRADSSGFRVCLYPDFSL